MATTGQVLSRQALAAEIRDGRSRTQDAANELWHHSVRLILAVEAGDAPAIAAITFACEEARNRLLVTLEQQSASLAKIHMILASKANPAVSGRTDVKLPADGTTPVALAKPPAPLGGKFTPKPAP